MIREDRMAERANPPPGEEQQLRQRAMRRLALALALIVAAIVGLGLLDHYTGRQRATAPATPSSEPPPIASLPQPTPLEPETPAPQAPPPAPTTALPPPPPPTIGDQPTAPPPASRTPDQPVAGAEIPRSTDGGPARGTAEPSPAARQRATAAAAPSAGGAPALEARTGFVVQLGMFTTVENAQALHTRLRQQGIPAFLETRVVVGPFRDRAEADAAQRKLQELGVGGVIVERK